MKKYIGLLMICMAVISFANSATAQGKKSELVTVCFKSSMDCHNCELTLTNFLKFEKGVKDLKVDLATNTIKVVYKAGKNTTENFAAEIRKKGYEANQISEEDYKKLMAGASKKQD
jgi:copper chaperone CopZ